MSKVSQYNLVQSKWLNSKTLLFLNTDYAQKYISYTYSPCDGYACPQFALCRDVSTDEDPITECECQFLRVMNEEGRNILIPTFAQLMPYNEFHKINLPTALSTI